ncbi:Plant lipid transfer protein/Par allergen [Corchorus olitorius]|uniref:Non-specific lipid-transfer protein n=1 Tax=Corchorus olitorius TaxID=93759 RepID=A0A1R3J1Y4_9ROSI|nr:Plant lipid transfer protein/Par allergen [Corchorus olitorius]
MAAHSLKLVCMVAMLCMLVPNPMATAALTCDKVNSQLEPCTGYIRSLGAGESYGKCCDGVRNLKRMALTPADHQDACKCIKNKLGDLGERLRAWVQTQNRIPRDKLEGLANKMESLAKALPGKCGVYVPYEISATTNCNE